MSLGNLFSTELLGGNKRAGWSQIKENNLWFINKTFLLSWHTFENPTRLSNDDLCRYWTHWLKLSEAGHKLTFKRVSSPKSDANPQTGKEEDQTEQEGGKRGSKGEEEGVEEEDKGEDEDKDKDKDKDDNEDKDKDEAIVEGEEEEEGVGQEKEQEGEKEKGG